MTCPKCQSASHGVRDSRLSLDNRIRRRRFCEDCGHAWTTYEVYATVLQESCDYRKPMIDWLNYIIPQMQDLRAALVKPARRPSIKRKGI